MNDEETLFSACMHEAAVCPQAFLERVKQKAQPDYWEIFWAFYAAIRLGDAGFKNQIVEERIDDVDLGNDFHLLLAYEKYLEHLEDPDYEGYLDFGKDFLSWAEEGLSPLLSDAFDALLSLLSPDDEEVPEVTNFYTQQLFIA